MSSFLECADFLKELERTSWEYDHLRKDQVISYLVDKLTKAAKLLGEVTMGEITLTPVEKWHKQIPSLPGSAAQNLINDWIAIAEARETSH